jgi:hypothetical protein
MASSILVCSAEAVLKGSREPFSDGLETVLDEDGTESCSGVWEAILKLLDEGGIVYKNKVI